MWKASRMPWAPELFSEPVLIKLEEQRRLEWPSVPYFDGLLTGEVDALVGSFAGEPEVHHPVNGRIRGKRAFTTFATETAAWLRERNVSVGDVTRVVGSRGGFEEVVVSLDDESGRVLLPIAIIAEKRSPGRLEELRIYSSSWPLIGRHEDRPPLLQRDPGLQQPDVVADYQRAIAAGDVDAVVAAFEPDGYVREPSGGEYVHSGPGGLRAFYERYFSNDGGFSIEHCALDDDGRTCALEYNIVRWGRTEFPPQAGVAVHERGPGGKLAAVRIYDDVDPPLAAGA
jgi:hypothetical protein